MLADHQREAVARALEVIERRGGVLLADEVGLGKSFVAAEVLRSFGSGELIVPASLVEQWKETLRAFDLDVGIATHDAIVSEPFVPMPDPRRLVVVDEAHAFRNPSTQRYAALARRAAGARVLLVTATPVCNSLGDLEALVRLFARDDQLADAGVPSLDVAFATRDRAAVEAIVASLVIRRGRDVLPPELRFGAIARSVIRHTVPPVPAIDELAFPLVGEHAMLRRLLHRRLESSRAALLESVRRQVHFYERALEAIAAGRTLPKRAYRNAFADEEDRAAFQQVLFWELFAPEGEGDAAAVREEIARLDRVVAEATSAREEKREAFIEVVAEEREPMLVFTGAIATAMDLHAAVKTLRRCGLVTSRERARDAVLHAFRRGLVDVLISTDMAAEGLNLQRAGVVVHYDIPWNPVRLDQRNGRAWRIGQEREAVRAIYFLPASRETGIARTMARKNRVRRRVLDRGGVAERACNSTLRPRVAAGAAFLRLQRVAGELPEDLARRHRAGIEQIMQEMSGEYFDRRRLEDLLALVAAAP